MKPKARKSPMVDHIAPALRGLASPVESFKAWDDNPRQGDIGAVSESLRRFGQQKPIVVQKSTRRVIAGNHTFLAAVALEWPTIAASVVDLTDIEATAYAIADNRTSDLAAYDDAKLLEQLRSLGTDDISLTGTGFDGEDVQRLFEKLDDSPIAASSVKEPDTIVARWGVVVECAGEEQQVTLLQRLQAEGLSCRALIA